MINLIYPDICIVCQNFFEPQKRVVESENFNPEFEDIFSNHFCSRCIKKYKAFSGAVCSRCGRLLNIPDSEDALCEGCLTKKSGLDKIRSCFLFRDSVVDIVHMFKYNDRVYLIKKTAYFILKAFLDLYIQNPPDFIFPVPMHSSGLRKRGYNQTYLMVLETAELAQNYGLFFPEVKNNILLKINKTESQTELDHNSRKKNLENVFKVKHPLLVKNRKILIIDDVMTTGTTLEKCAEELLKNGADSVDAITFARA
jgi:ComF family protein